MSAEKFEELRTSLREGYVRSIRKAEDCSDNACVLLSAIEEKDVAKVRRLITRSKVCVNSKAHEMGGWTALVAAARDGLVNIVKFLHQANADIDATNDDGQTAMILAAEGGHLATVRYLVEVAEANVDVVDNYGDTALIYASRIDRFEVVRYLVEEAKANVFHRGWKGMNVFEWTEDVSEKLEGYQEHEKKTSSFLRHNKLMVSVH
ncbi:hypothetical protein AAMO2058_001492300 [Amorphochlora amoebiformis]